MFLELEQILAVSSYPAKKNYTPEVILYTMSYVPPHLRNSSAGKTTTLNSDGAAADYFSSKLSSHQSRIHCNGELDKFSSNGYSNSSRRSSVNYSTTSRTAIPDPEFPQWKPSERVLRLKSEQVRIFSSTRK